MTLEGGQDKDLYPMLPQAQGHQLHSEGLSRAAGAQDGHIGVFVEPGVEDVHHHQGVVVLVDPHKDAVVIAHLETGEGVAAGRPGGQDIPLGFPVELFSDASDGQNAEQRILLQKTAHSGIHVLGDQQLSHLLDPPIQVLHAVRCDGDDNGQVVEILVVGDAPLEEIPGLDGIGEVVKVGIGVAGILDLAAVDADLLPDLLLDTLLGLFVEEQVYIDPFPGIDDEGKPARHHLHLVGVCRDDQIAVVEAVHEDIPGMGEVNGGRRYQLIDIHLLQFRGLIAHDIPAQYLRHPFPQRNLRRGLSVKEDVKDLADKLVLVVVFYDVVAALEQKAAGVSGGGFQYREDLPVVRAAVGVVVFVLENKEEPSGHCLTGAQPPDEAVVILLQLPAPRLRLLLHTFPQLFQMPAHIRLFGDDLELQLHRADLQQAGKGVDDPTLFPGAPQKEVQRLHLQNFDVPAVLGDNDAVFDPVDGEIVLEDLGVLQLALHPFAGLLLVCSCRRLWGVVLKFIPPGSILRHLSLAVIVDDLEVLLICLDLPGGELGPQAV